MDEEKIEQRESVPAEASAPVPEEAAQLPAEAPEQAEKPGPNMRTHYLIRILVGGYLAYLGWQLLRSFIDGSAGSRPVAIIGGLAFLVLGIALVIWSVLLMTRDDS